MIQRKRKMRVYIISTVVFILFISRFGYGQFQNPGRSPLDDTRDRDNFHESDVSVDFKETAKENYLLGLDALKDESFREAIQYFNFVRNRFPFSQYSALSDLKIADSYFEDESFAEAASAYADFIRLRPSHEEVAYATFRIALSQYRRLPGDWWIFPPPYEKDLSTANDTISAIQSYIHQFEYSKKKKDTQYIAEAKTLLKECNNRLSQHEWYVAAFYLHEGHIKAGLGRLDTLIKNYENSDLYPEAILLFSETTFRMKDLEIQKISQAKELLQKITAGDYNQAFKEKAQNLLHQFGS